MLAWVSYFLLILSTWFPVPGLHQQKSDLEFGYARTEFEVDKY
jgi:hypothetical protein